MMREEWNERARKNTYHYVSTSRKDWDDPAFFEWGEKQVTLFVDKFLELKSLIPAQMVVLEIGCGAGRLTRAFARRFKRVYAYDVSDVYIALAKGKNSHLENTSFFTNDGKSFPEVPDRSVNFVFSGWVFQHMPSKDVVIANIQDFSRTLKVGGLYKFDPQISKPQTLKTKMLKVAGSAGFGDHLKSTKTFRGMSFSIEEMKAILSNVGLSVNVTEELDGNIMKPWFHGQRL